MLKWLERAFNGTCTCVSTEISIDHIIKLTQSKRLARCDFLGQRCGVIHLNPCLSPSYYSLLFFYKSLLLLIKYDDL